MQAFNFINKKSYHTEDYDLVVDNEIAHQALQLLLDEITQETTTLTSVEEVTNYLKTLKNKNYGTK